MRTGEHLNKRADKFCFFGSPLPPASAGSQPAACGCAPPAPPLPRAAPHLLGWQNPGGPALRPRQAAPCGPSRNAWQSWLQAETGSLGSHACLPRQARPTSDAPTRSLLSCPSRPVAAGAPLPALASHLRLAFSARSTEHAWRSCAICAATGSRLTTGLLRMLRARLACKEGYNKDVTLC